MLGTIYTTILWLTQSIIAVSPTIELTDEQFFQLCQHNQDLRIERTAQGELIIMPLAGWGSGSRNARLTARLGNWTDSNGAGVAFDSSTGYKLPNGANRSPDGSWISRERLEALNPDPARFMPMPPDFAVELRSATDGLRATKRKMQEYLDCGVRLCWLIDPQNQQVEIYRLGKDVEVLKSPASLFGEDVLPGFVLDLTGILD